MEGTLEGGVSLFSHCCLRMFWNSNGGVDAEGGVDQDHNEPKTLNSDAEWMSVKCDISPQKQDHKHEW